MTFEECVNNLHKGSVINFNEYVLDRHEKRRLTLSITDGVVQEVIPANQKLDRDTLEQLYGTELDETDYLQLSQMNCPRVVVGLGLNSHGELDIKIIILNEDFYNTHLQELSVTNEVNALDYEPNYLMAQNGW